MKKSGELTSSEDTNSQTAVPATGPRGVRLTWCGNQERILVVEDDDAVRMIISQMLSCLGYSVSSSAEPADAVDLAHKEYFDLALLDLMLPRENGVRTAARLLAISPSIKIAYMTAMREEDHARNGVDMSVPPEGYATRPDILRKPFDIEALARVVRGALGARAA